MSAMHKLVYKMYLEKIEAMEKDKDEMLKLIADPNDEFEDEEEEGDEEAGEENGEANIAAGEADGKNLFLGDIQPFLEVIQNEVEEPIPKKHQKPAEAAETAEKMDES